MKLKKVQKWLEQQEKELGEKLILEYSSIHGFTIEKAIIGCVLFSGNAKQLKKYINESLKKEKEGKEEQKEKKETITFA